MRQNLNLILAFVLLVCFAAPAFASPTVTCWFPPGWKSKRAQAKGIADALTAKAGITITPRIAKSYPQILQAFTTDQYNLVYVGSFVQAIINARGLGTALVQNINGKDLYCGIMVCKESDSPAEILAKHPSQVAYTMGASSGESSAKAATKGQAAMGVRNHAAAARAVLANRAKAAVVKNWWWEKNKKDFAGLKVYEVPGVSVNKNPDNVLTVSKSIPSDLVQKISAAAIASKKAFAAPEMVPFDAARLKFSLELMKMGGIDPMTYNWK